MALSFIQKPLDGSTSGSDGDRVPVLTNYTPAVGYMLEQDSSIASYFYYKLVLEIRETDSTGTLIGIIRQKRNGYAPDVSSDKARAFFDLKEIINSQLVVTTYDQNQTSAPFVTIHKVGFNNDQKSFSYSGDAILGKSQILPVYVKGYQHYSEDAGTIPADVTTGSVDETLWYLQASLPITDARAVISGSEPEYIQGSAFSKFRGSYFNNQFLSSVQKMRLQNYKRTIIGTTAKVFANFVFWDSSNSIGDWHTVAFLNYKTKFYSNIKHIEVAYYDASGGNLSVIYFDNESSKGGEVPTGAITKHNALLYFGCGTANLQNQGFSANARPSHVNNTDWEYYTIRGTSGDDDSVNDDGSTGFPLDQDYHQTEAYYFIRDNCSSRKGYKMRRLAWFNTKGGYDYYNFKLKSTQTLEVTRDNYQKTIGTFNQDYYTYNNTSRGTTTRKVTAILKETLETDYMLEEEAELLETLIISKKVDIVENVDTDYTESVVVLDTSFVRKTNANDRGTIKYTIQIEYANPRNTNT
jgi:hypothetical protein